MNISVAMTTYNGASFLKEQLDSMFAQSRLPDELIVCDDQSTDTTSELLQDYAARAPFPMKVIINEERLGSTKNFEKAIGLCSGDLIFLSDQDDAWMPAKVATMEARFDAEPDVGLIFTNGGLIDKKGSPLSRDLWDAFRFGPQRRAMLGGAARYDLLLSRSFITGATMAFRSQFKSLCLPIPDGLKTFVHDRWIAILIASVARIAFVDEKLIAYRVHPLQQLGVGKTFRPLNYVMPYRFSCDRVALAKLRERLEANRAWSPKPEFLGALDVRLRHSSARAALPRNPFRRLGPVIEEYRSGRYRYYGGGLLNALKDIVMGAR